MLPGPTNVGTTVTFRDQVAVELLNSIIDREFSKRVSMLSDLQLVLVVEQAYRLANLVEKVKMGLLKSADMAEVESSEEPQKTHWKPV